MPWWRRSYFRAKSKLRSSAWHLLSITCLMLGFNCQWALLFRNSSSVQSFMNWFWRSSHVFTFLFNNSAWVIRNNWRCIFTLFRLISKLLRHFLSPRLVIIRERVSETLFVVILVISVGRLFVCSFCLHLYRLVTRVYTTALLVKQVPIFSVSFLLVEHSHFLRVHLYIPSLTIRF